LYTHLGPMGSMETKAHYRPTFREKYSRARGHSHAGTPENFQGTHNFIGPIGCIARSAFLSYLA